MIDWAGISTAIAATASAIVSIIVALRVNDVKGAVTEVKKSVDVVTAHTNGMVEKITQLAEAKGAAVGKLEGRAEVRAESKVNGDKPG